jgi:hypothetical protein
MMVCACIAAQIMGADDAGSEATILGAHQIRADKARRGIRPHVDRTSEILDR